MADLRTQDTSAEEKKIEHIKPCKLEMHPKIEVLAVFPERTNYVKQFETVVRMINGSDR